MRKEQARRLKKKFDELVEKYLPDDSHLETLAEGLPLDDGSDDDDHDEDEAAQKGSGSPSSSDNEEEADGDSEEMPGSNSYGYMDGDDTLVY